MVVNESFAPLGQGGGKMKYYSHKLVCVCLLFILLMVSAQVVFAAQKININTATVSELVALNGIGEKTAMKIVAHREAEGDFKAIEGIVAVKGIGEKSFVKLADQITVDSTKSKK